MREAATKVPIGHSSAREVLLARYFVRNRNLAAALVAVAMVGLWHFGLGLAYVALLLALILAGVLRRRSVPDAAVG